MNEEIKIKVSQPMFEDGELERFDTYINEIANEFTKLHFAEKDKILTQRLVKKLEQENEKLKEELQAYKQERENILDKSKRLNYKLRIDKAIEYIKQYGNLYCLKHKQFKDYYQYKELLNILKGSDKE